MSKDYYSVLPDDKMAFLRLEISNVLNDAFTPFTNFNLTPYENPNRANVMTHTQGIAGQVFCSIFFDNVQSDTFCSSGRRVGFFPAVAS